MRLIVEHIKTTMRKFATSIPTATQAASLGWKNVKKYSSPDYQQMHKQQLFVPDLKLHKNRKLSVRVYKNDALKAHAFQ